MSGKMDINVLSYLANSTWSRITKGNRKIVVLFICLNFDLIFGKGRDNPGHCSMPWPPE